MHGQCRCAQDFSCKCPHSMQLMFLTWVSKVVPMSEINRFWDTFANYDGDSNAPLLWWKVMPRDSVCISQLLTDPAHIDPRIGVSDHFKNGVQLSCHSWDQCLSRAVASSARHLCHESRASLKPRTIQEAMLTKMWIKEGLLKTASLECGRGQYL
jgi:hypothetical protein